jgi:hypothetical protein
MPSKTDTDAPLPIGISAHTGRPLNVLTDDAVQAMLGRERKPSPETAALSDRADSAGVAFAVQGGIDANDLA